MLTLLVIRTLFFLAAVTGAGGQEWSYYSGDTSGSKYSPLDQINRSNVAKLQGAWASG